MEQTLPSVTENDLLRRVHEVGPVLREHAERAERERRLTGESLRALAGAGFQRLLTPRSLGGLEVDPVTCARVIEEVARHDSAAGWALQAGNAGGWWSARLPDEGAEEIHRAHPDALMAAAFHPPQRAREVPGGYRITGRGPLASTVHDAEWLMLSAMLWEDDRPRMTPFGPELIAGVLRTSEATILDTWRTLGMRGTDSNDVAVDEVFVPASRAFRLTPEFTPGRHFQGPLYRFPAVGMVGFVVAAVLLAIGQGALSAFRELAGSKTPFGSARPLRERSSVQGALASAEAILRSARLYFYDTLRRTWERTAAGQGHSLEQRADLLLANVHVARSVSQVADTVHRLAGTSGIYTRSPLDRHFRDAQTLRHHGFVSESKLEAVGQVYLGLPPDFPLLAF